MAAEIHFAIYAGRSLSSQWLGAAQRETGLGHRTWRNGFGRRLAREQKIGRYSHRHRDQRDYRARLVNAPLAAVPCRAAVAARIGNRQPRLCGFEYESI